MNLGQLYRRTAAYIPGVRPRLSERARWLINESIEILKQDEKDLRSLPMAIAAAAGDDPGKRPEEKIKAIDDAIEYSEQWNQDDIQIGSAYYAKGWLLATVDPSESEDCYLKALELFRRAGMKGEIARTELELAFVLSIQARQKVAETQSSWEWKFGTRVLGALKVIHALGLSKTILAAIIVVFVLFLILAFGAVLR
jgi:hypothetical protein